jgi:23S rRNA (cytidine1920-2'-O)/16S rRNA (cytidine1409-2'-O)-methyltransferase
MRSESKCPGKAGRLDIGASTGGFTDCLLQRGAAGVVAVDAGRAQLHEKLRNDPRVRVMEKTNARFLTLEALGGRPAALIVIDVSFISLRLILPVCAGLLADGGRVVALIKPQFEAGRGEVGSGGVVRDPAVHRRVLEGLAGFFRETGWSLRGLTTSPIRGSDGNVEFFALLERDGAGHGPERDQAMIDAVLPPRGEENPVESP